jgi:signal transduction histidine kinase
VHQIFPYKIYSINETFCRVLNRRVNKEKGAGAYDELTDPNGPWVGDNYYLFLNDFEGNVVAHRIKKLVGKNLYGVRDVKGTPFVAVSQEIVRSEAGFGWYDWWWPKPNETEPSHKVGFSMRVPGQKILVGSAIYDMNPSEIKKILKKQSP